MVEWYHSVYDKARKIEGASQRVQEDTIKFSRIMESLGTSLIEALMILVEFMPILFAIIPLALNKFKKLRANHGFGKRRAERIRSARSGKSIL